MNTRAIHLEIVNSMSVEDFILAFVRFYNRYGCPKVLYSDNAKSFLAGSSLLADLIATSQFQQKFIKFNISHKTIPSYSPWFGSTYERLIKTVKQCIYKVFGRSITDETNFVTSLSDIQLSINNRPLTYRDSNNLDVVTPNHLITTRSSFPSLIISEENFEGEMDEAELRNKLLNSLEHRDVVFNKFQKEWYNRYLLSLRERHKNSFCIKDQHENPDFLHVGSVVLIKNPVRPRPYWTLCRILELLPGEDDIVRVVKVLRPDRSTTTTSIANLYPLELCSKNSSEMDDNLSIEEDIAVNNTPPADVQVDTGTPSVSSRPIRQAAVNFKNKLRSWLKEDSI